MRDHRQRDRKSTRLNSSHLVISYAVFCLKKKNPSWLQIPPAYAVRLCSSSRRHRSEGGIPPSCELPCYRGSRSWQPHLFCFFFNDTAPTEIYTFSLHDALPISLVLRGGMNLLEQSENAIVVFRGDPDTIRSEEHTSELQSPCNLVCRLLLE